MGQSSDQIRQEIDQKRTDAATKIDTLKDQVQGNADQMRGQVEDTVDQVREGVQGTVEDTIETVKQNIDLKKQMEERPLVALGTALLGGFVLGGLMGSGGGQQSQSGGASSGGASSGVRNAVKQSGLEDTISNAAAALMGNVTEQVKQTLDSNFPGFADKMSSAQQQPGTLSEKTRVVQSDASRTR